MFGSHKRISRLEADIEQIKRELREITVDLPDLQRKMVRVLRNTARERARLEQLDTETGGKTEQQAEPVAGSATSPFLTPRQRQLQQQILHRRAGG